MNEQEAYIENILRSLSVKEELRIMNLGSKFLRSLRDREAGDAVSLILTDVAPRPNTIERIEAILSDPTHALIDVKYVDGMLDTWEGQTIGLAASLEYSRGSIKTLPHFVAGAQQFAYFSPEDMHHHDGDKLTVAPENIHHLALQYGKLAINGAVIFDFITQHED
jgi:hypothetical protein